MLTRTLIQFTRGFPPAARFDVVHAHHLFPEGHAAMRLASHLGVPMVATGRGSDVHSDPGRSRGVLRHTRATIEGADRVTVVSAALGAAAARLGRSRRPIEVVYSGVDLETFQPAADGALVRARLGLPGEGLGICAVGRLVPEKGLNELMEAFTRLRVDRPDSWLAIVGTGPMRDRLRTASRERGFADRLFLPGSVPHSAIADWLNAADIFTLPSYAEGLPGVVLEAMACGRPIVATTVGGIPEAAPDNLVARLVPPRDAAALSAALRELAEDPVARRSLGEAGRRRAEEVFSWAASAERMAAVYESVRAPAAPPPPSRSARPGTGVDRPPPFLTSATRPIR